MPGKRMESGPLLEPIRCRPRAYYCPPGHAHSCDEAFRRMGYTRIKENATEISYDSIVADARAASVCWLPGWPEQKFASFVDYDKVSVCTAGGTFDLLLSPQAVTNLRTNVDSVNLWDKAALLRAMGPREWLPFQFVRDVDRNKGLLGVLPEADAESEFEVADALAAAQEGAAGGVHHEDDYLDPFDMIYMEVMQEAGKTKEAKKCLDQYAHNNSDRITKMLFSEYLLQQMRALDPQATLEGVKWIYKPADGNKASGILIFKDHLELEEHLRVLQMYRDKQVGVIQQYLERPWLVELVESSIAGEANDPAFYRSKLPHLRSKKFDMRMFLLVTYEPRTASSATERAAEPWLKAFMHREGICRFSTADYDAEDLSEENRRAHLTNNALNKHAKGYKASNNLINLQDLERLMPRGWTLDKDFYPYVRDQICSTLAAHVASGHLPRRGFQLLGIDLMFVEPKSRYSAPGIYLLEVNLRPKIDIPDEVSVDFKRACGEIIKDVILCVEQHHFTEEKIEQMEETERQLAQMDGRASGIKKGGVKAIFPNREQSDLTTRFERVMFQLDAPVAGAASEGARY